MTRHERLQELARAPAAVGDPLEWTDWNEIEAWAANARPFISQHFSAEVTRFEALVAEPRWVQLAQLGDSVDEGVWRARKRVESRENARLVNAKRAWIQELLDELARR